MKNHEQFQWSVLPVNIEVLRLALEILLVFLKNVVDLLFLSGVVLVLDSTGCCSIPGMLRLYHNQCEFLSMVDKLLCLFGIDDSNCWCRFSL